MRRYSFRGLVRSSHYSRMTWVGGSIVLLFASYSTIGHGGAFADTTSTTFFVDPTTALRNDNGHRYHRPRTKALKALRVSSVQQDALSSSQPKPPLPPMDETFSSPIAALREQLSAPSLPTSSARYDEIGLKTGGIWRTKRYGMVPCTLVAAQVMTPWLAKEEAVGNVFSAWPQSVVELFGRKSLLTLGEEPNVHAAVRRVFNDLLSPRAVARLRPFMELCLKRHACRWDEIASSGKMVRMFDDISSFTMEVIAHCFLGDYGTGEVLEKLQWIVPAVADGLISKPRRFPWPLNRMPGHKYGTAMDARKEFDAVVGGVVRQRRLDLAAEPRGKDGARRKAGVLDAMLEMQAKQIEEGGPTNEEMEYDDIFILDNVSIPGVFELHKEIPR